MKIMIKILSDRSHLMGKGEWLIGTWLIRMARGGLQSMIMMRVLGFNVRDSIDGW